MLRVGEEGMTDTELSVVLRTGDAPFEGLDELAAVAAGSDFDTALVESSVFFLPMPKRPLILFFFSGSSVFCVVLSEPVGALTLSPFVGSKGSANAGTEGADVPLCNGAVPARLMIRLVDVFVGGCVAVCVWYRLCSCWNCCRRDKSVGVSLFRTWSWTGSVSARNEQFMSTRDVS